MRRRPAARTVPPVKHAEPMPPRAGPVRVVLGTVAALAIAVVLLVAVEGFGVAVHPFPPDFAGTHDEVCAHVARYPAWVLAAVVPMWGLAAFASAWAARRIGRSPVAAVIAGVAFVSAIALNLAMLPYPWWVRAGAFVAVAGGAALGGRTWRAS